MKAGAGDSKSVLRIALLAIVLTSITAVADGDMKTFAVVDGTVITAQAVDFAVANAAVQRFYHRRPRDEQLAALKREVSEGLVNRVLLVNEARRRGFAPDAGKVRAQVAAYQRRVPDATQWERLLPELTRSLEEQNLVAQLESAARSLSDPDEPTLAAYYAAHAERFTEPERLRVSVILLKVEPSSPAAAWDDAAARAAAVAGRIAAGESFEALARAESQDEHAAQGGDAGYLHRGMIVEHVQDILDRLEPGSVTEPLRVLEGVAIFRLDERKPASLKPLAEVRARALELWRQEQGDKEWRELIAALREKGTITIAAPE